MTVKLIDQVPSHRGHFRLESAYHAACYIDLEPFVKSPERVESRITLLAERLKRHAPDWICGTPNGGAHVASMVARELGVSALYALPETRTPRRDPLSVKYRLVLTDPSVVVGARVAIVNDLIISGSRVRALRESVLAHGAETPAVGALLALGRVGLDALDERAIPAEVLEQESYEMWTPPECPLCSAGVPLVRVEDAIWNERGSNRGEPRSARSAADKFVAMLAEPTLEEAIRRRDAISDEVQLLDIADSWVQAVVALNAGGGLSDDESMYFLDLLTAPVIAGAIATDAQLQKLAAKMDRVAKAHGLENSFVAEAKALPELVELNKRYRWRLNDLQVAYWRTKGAVTAAKVLERSPEELKMSGSRGWEEFARRWSAAKER